MGGPDRHVLDRYSRRMSTPSARLEVVAGNAAGTVIEVQDELLIGRHAEGPGRLADDQEISRSHARVAVEPGGFCAIEDLGSTNGTFLNGLRVSGPKTLAVGDTIELGGTTLVVSELTFGDGEPAPARGDSQTTPRVPRPASVPVIPIDDVPGPITVATEAVAESQPEEPQEPAEPAEPAEPEEDIAPVPPPLSLQLDVDFAAGEATIKLTDDSDGVRLAFDGTAWRVQPPQD
jgi:predicted component of type VI protein secretion system